MFQRAYEKFVLILDLYQEQPHLLDPKLESLLRPLLIFARNTGDYTEETNKFAFNLLMHITKVRGYKTMLRYLPHEVTDLEPTLTLLENQNPVDYSSFGVRYMLLLWLVIICKIPFDLKRFDSDRKTRESTTIKRLLAVSRTYLESPTSDKCGEMAAVVMANLLTRPDVKTNFLQSEINTELQKLHGLK